jgi:8-oxo-dGTP diphosphatase
LTKKRYKKEHIVTSVVAVIVDDDGRVLLTKRSIPPFQDLWVMPGGKIDLGEPILEALKREVHEEVGLEVEVEGLVDVFEHLTPGKDNCHFVILYYRCRPLYCDVVHNEQEVSDTAWVPCQNLSNYTMPAGACFILRKVFPELSCPLTPADAHA